MKDIIHRILNKRGLKLEELSVEEKETYETWNAVLSKDQLTTEDIKNFCQSQVDVIEGKWADLNVEQSKKAEMIPYHTVYNLLLKVIDSPKEARNALEKNLQQLL